MNSTAIQFSRLTSGPAPTARRMIPPVGRKRENDPMKLFPYLFQFASPRLSDSKENGDVGVYAGRAKLCLSRGFPRRTRLQRYPPLNQSFELSREARPWPMREMRDAKIQHLVRAA